jgi:hypothetical protein
MAESKKGSNLLILLTSIILSSCGNANPDNEFEIKHIFVEQNFHKYEFLYSQANDSLKYWIKDSLSIATYFVTNPAYSIESVFIFNIDSTRFYTVVIKQDTGNKDAVYDYVLDFGGAKINGKWYFFFMGVSSPVERSNWQDSVYAPLTFEELSYVAYEWNFKTLIKNINEGHPEKNEAFFRNTFFNNKQCLSSADPKKCFDDRILRKVGGEYAYKLDPKEIADIKRAMAESKIPSDKPLVIERSFWDKLQDGEKTFESKAWKDYLRKKHQAK